MSKFSIGIDKFKTYANAFVMFPAICFMTAVAIQEVKKNKNRNGEESNE